MIIELDGQVMTKEDITGFGDFPVTERIENEEGEISRSFTQELTFRNKAWDIIYANLIDTPTGNQNFVTIQIFDTCCGSKKLEFEGIIRGDSLNWCYDECQATGNAIERTDDTDKVDCFNSTLIDDNRNGFQSQDHPRMTYCDEIRPSWLHDVILIFGIILNIIYFILYPIAVIVIVIVGAINSLGGNIDFDGDDETNNLQTWNGLRNTLNQIIIGCGRQHPSPLLRDYIKNVCTICGITFQSPILNDPALDYYDTVYLNAPVEKGTRDTTIKWIKENRPIETGATLMNKIKIPFNAKWEVRDGILTFDRKDKFQNNPIWVDYLDLKNKGQIVEELCFSWSGDKKWAFLDIKHINDAVDITGNEAWDRFADKAEWNSPPSPLQSGKKEVLIPFSPLRVRDDGIDRDVLAGYSWFYNIINNYDSTIIMTNGTSFAPKLVIWNGNIANGKVRKFPYWNSQIPNSQNYNAPYQCNEFNILPNTIYPINQPNCGLIGRFHSIDNPRVYDYKGLDFKFSFKYNCEQINSFDIKKNIQLPNGSAQVLEVTKDLENQIIKITGKL